MGSPRCVRSRAPRCHGHTICLPMYTTRYYRLKHMNCQFLMWGWLLLIHPYLVQDAWKNWPLFSRSSLTWSHRLWLIARVSLWKRRLLTQKQRVWLNGTASTIVLSGKTLHVTNIPHAKLLYILNIFTQNFWTNNTQNEPYTVDDPNLIKIWHVLILIWVYLFIYVFFKKLNIATQVGC